MALQENLKPTEDDHKALEQMAAQIEAEKKHNAAPNTSPTSVMLTLSEQESLRQNLRELNAYCQKAFKKPL